MKTLLITLLTLISLNSLELKSQDCCNNLEMELLPDVQVVHGDSLFFIDVNIRLVDIPNCIYADSISMVLNEKKGETIILLDKSKHPTTQYAGLNFRNITRLYKFEFSNGTFEFLFTGIAEDTCRYEIEIKESDYLLTSVGVDLVHNYLDQTSFIITDYLDIESYIPFNNIYLSDEIGNYEKLNTNNNIIDFSNKANGIYFIIIETRNSNKVLKVLKI